MSAQRWDAVARLHADAIDQGFLATLGVGFLSLLYRAIDESPSGILLVEEREGRLAGFVAGSEEGMGPILRRLLRHPLRLAAALLPVVAHPARLGGIVEVLRAGGHASDTAGLPRAELLSLAVAPSHRRQRVAEALYARLRERFAARGIASFRIVVGASLLPAQRFYERMGARAAARTEVHRGNPSIIYVQQARSGAERPDGSIWEERQ